MLMNLLGHFVQMVAQISCTGEPRRRIVLHKCAFVQRVLLEREEEIVCRQNVGCTECCWREGGGDLFLLLARGLFVCAPAKELCHVCTASHALLLMRSLSL